MSKREWLIGFGLGLFVSSFFGVGLQSTSVLGLLQPICFLLYLHIAHSPLKALCAPFVNEFILVVPLVLAAVALHPGIFEKAAMRAVFWILGAVIFTLGSVFAFAGMFAEGYVDGVSMLTVMGFSSAFAAVLVVFSYLAYLRFFRRFVMYWGFLVTLAFPTLVASVYFLLFYTPMGDIVTPTYTQLDNTSVMMVASIFGISGINFLIHWVAAVVHYFIVKNSTIVEEKFDGDKLFYDVRGLYTLLGIVVVLFFTGSLLSGLYGGRFYQVPLNVTIPMSIPVSCVLGSDDTIPTMINRTMESLSQIPKPQIILWAEESAALQTQLEETQLAANISAIARNTSTYIGIAYHLHEGKLNKFVLISDAGDIIINYSKSHPVPGMEDINPGPAVLQSAQTKYGRMGAAICFDFDYPQFISQAGRDEVDIMLQPSWTWGGMGRYHALVNHVRAVENGFTMFRCASTGYSGVFAPDYTKVSFQPTMISGIFNSYLPITKKNWTWYGVFGETFSWFCVFFGAVYVLLGFLKASWLDRLFSKIPFLTWLRIEGNELHHQQDQIKARQDLILGAEKVKAEKLESDALLSK